MTRFTPVSHKNVKSKAFKIQKSQTVAQLLHFFEKNDFQGFRNVVKSTIVYCCTCFVAKTVTKL